MLVSGPLAQWSPLRRWGMGATLAVAFLVGKEAEARRQALPEFTIPVSQLPAEGQAVHRSIHAGGPFPHPKDGSVFGNRERLLPASPRGFYREYTVSTPGSRDRGARRIVCGGARPKAPDACFYTADHYNSFQRISP